MTSSHPVIPNSNRRQLLAVLAGLCAAPAWADFRVEITGVGATQIPIAIASFRDEIIGAVPVAGIIRANLERSGLFRSLPVEGNFDERSTLDLALWRSRGADAMVAGSVQQLSDGRIDVRYKLWDAVRSEQLLGQSKVVVRGDLRLAAHRIADEVHQSLTGERGIYATRLAFVKRTGARYTLHVTDADGEGGQVALSSTEAIISPAWSSDGRRLAYVSFEDQKAVVWVQTLSTGERKRVANFRGSNSAPAWSPDGQRLMVALSQDGQTQLYTVPAAGGKPERFLRSSGIDTEPVFTADGRFVYFVSDRGGGPQIYRVAAGGGAVDRVTFAGAYNISPSISPDGNTLAFISRQGSAFKLMTLGLRTGTLTVLTDTEDDASPSFAPNGRLLVYATKQAGAGVLMTSTPDGKIKTRLLSTGADMRSPAWGPFGR